MGAQLRHLAASRESLASCAVIFGLIATAVAVTRFGGPALQATAANGFVLLILVIGLGVFVGSTGIISFGHASFAALAAYTSAFLTIPVALKLRLLPAMPQWLLVTDLPLPVSLLVSVAVCTAIGLVIGVVIVGLEGASAAIATLGLLIITNNLLVGAAPYTRGAQSLYGIPEGIGPLTAALLACGIFVLGRSFKDSTFGLLSRAARDDAIAARSIGISLKRARMVPWVLSVAIISLGGAMTAHRLTVISPKEFYFGQSFEWLVVLVVGGMFSLLGNLLGTLLIVVLVEVLRHVEQGVSLFGLVTPQVFGLTNAGLSVAILVTLVRRGSGLAGHTELDQLGPFAARPSALSVLERRTPPAEAPAKTNGQPLRVKALTKVFGGVTALDNVSFEIEPGTIVGLIGPNGSGKSTLLGCVSGILKPTSGIVTLGDAILTGQKPEQILRSGIARTFQNIRLFGNLTVRENVEAALLACGRVRRRADSYHLAGTILDRNGLMPFADRRATTLSYGDQRRLEIARAQAALPKFMLLDEPAAGMNEAESRALAALLLRTRTETGVGLLVVEHDLSFVMSICDQIVVLEKGQKIATGTPGEIVRNERVIKAYLGQSRSSLGPVFTGPGLHWARSSLGPVFTGPGSDHRIQQPDRNRS